MKTDLVTCKKCGWVSFALTKAEATAEVEKFNNWLVGHLKTHPEDKKFYPKESSVEDYKCLGCDGSDFRPYKNSDGDMNGHTINPVVYEKT